MIDVRRELRARTPRSREIYEKSAEVLAAEVVSTIEMPHPFYVAEAKGSKIRDVDGNEYIDLTMGMGPHVLGHAPDFVIEAVREAAPRGLQVGLHNPHQERLARLMVSAAPALEQVVFANSGTEATLYAVRAARAYTGKTKVAVFDGSYHGVHDYVLTDAHRSSPREAPVVYPRGAGIPDATMAQVIMLPYRRPEAFDLIRAQQDDLALVLLEPVQSSNPRLDQAEWMRELREVCRECGVLFVMDEVITGFRLAFGGGQEQFDVAPDLATYGKIIGGGTPVGAVAGPAEIMRVFTTDRRVQEAAGLEPIKPIFSGTTFGGNPLTMIAGAAQVQYLKDHADEVYPHLAKQGNRLTASINRLCEDEGFPARMMNAQSMLHLHFGTQPIEGARDIDTSHAKAETEFYLHLLYHGVIVPGVHIGFVSAAHSDEDIDHVVGACAQSFRAVREQGLI